MLPSSLTAITKSVPRRWIPLSNPQLPKFWVEDAIICIHSKYKVPIDRKGVYLSVNSIEIRPLFIDLLYRGADGSRTQNKALRIYNHIVERYTSATLKANSFS